MRSDGWLIQNLIVFILICVLFRIGQALWQKEYWRSAMKQMFKRKLVIGSFIVLCAYVGIALLDSIGYHHTMRDDKGNVFVNATTGRAIRNQDGLSVLDILLTPIRSAREKTYSSPLATHQFTKETLTTAEGKTIRDYPPLKYPHRHLLGTDRVGNDIFYLSLKSIRTGMIIGGFTTLLIIPFAIIFGVVAGYFRGWADDIIQYIYTVLASIPSILLISAFMIIVDTKFQQMSRLTALCIIMGITSWTGLCRVLRGETLKLREMEYVQAAKTLGIPPAQIMLNHIVPNLMHIVLITSILGFSGRVLSEAILTYVGVGVGADTISWGGMINDALRELARHPIVWWKLAAALTFTIGLLIPANLFGDALRDALDPKLKTE